MVNRLYNKNSIFFVNFGAIFIEFGSVLIDLFTIQNDNNLLNKCTQDMKHVPLFVILKMMT